MTLTEEQARTKWCPFARVGNEAGCNRNGESPSGFSPNCIASDCMAWRWKESDALETENDAISRRVKEVGGSTYDAAKYVSQHRSYRISTPATEGFCGLAKRPV